MQACINKIFNKKIIFATTLLLSYSQLYNKIKQVYNNLCFEY